LRDTVKTLPLYAELRKQKFTTKRVGQQRHPGVLSIIAGQICGGNFPSEVVAGYSTSPSDMYPFGDEPIPQIALVGSSFSANRPITSGDSCSSTCRPTFSTFRLRGAATTAR